MVQTCQHAGMLFAVQGSVRALERFHQLLFLSKIAFYPFDDVSETDTDYVVNAEIPGVKKEDIKVSVEGNQVSIRTELKRVREEKEGKQLRTERYYGEQQRSFTLAHEIDDDKVLAKYAEGVLVLTLPKKAGKTGKQIAVS